MPLSWNEIRDRAVAFAREWEDEQSEHAEAKTFWDEFFRVFGVSRRRLASFEANVKKASGAQGFIDLFWPGVLIAEHKSRGKDLNAAYSQAIDYFPGLSDKELPRYVIVSDFARFRLRNMETGEEIEFPLAELPQRLSVFGFVAGYEARTYREQDPVNIRAASKLADLHDALRDVGYDGHELEVCLVRLLFCLFAEDTGIFMPRSCFEDFIRDRTSEDGADLAPWLSQLFQVLNTPPERRLRNLDEQLAAFPYVNGKLFAEALPQASFDRGMRDTLLACCELDWGGISPAIFGSLFQGIMDEKVRSNLGAHYTSETNILKVIGPLFMDDLRAEFNKVRRQRGKLVEFHEKLASLTFFDPACGCGNFLVISYREIRRLELEVIEQLHGKQTQQLALNVVEQYVKVDVDQFFGIEIEEWPAQIARVAMWLIDHQMNLDVGRRFGQALVRVPLVKSANIHYENALTLNWNDVLPGEQCRYLFGNPPFLGKKAQSPAQKADLAVVYGDANGYKELDLVAAWFVKAARYMSERTRCAFVATNSITQGEQPGILWQQLWPLNVAIQFAHRTFRWSNEAPKVAAVHVVVIGLVKGAIATRVLYDYDTVNGEPHAVSLPRINPYLIDGPDVCAMSRRRPLDDVPPIVFGSMANDGGNLLLSDDERAELITAEPCAKRYIRPFIGADEFLNGASRWCLWLVDLPPGELHRMPEVKARVAKVKRYRAASTRAATNKLAKTPALFAEIRQPAGACIVVPRHSSETRAYVPIAFMDGSAIIGDANLCIPDATPFHFGVLMSAMHMAWVSVVAGRIKSDYRYTNEIVYNNFPWPVGDDVAPTRRAVIERAADAVLAARAKHPGATLSELYAPLGMPKTLVKAHQALDSAVDAAYVGLGGKRSWANETERVSFLLGLYEARVAEEAAIAAAAMAARPRRRRGATAAA